MRSLFTLLLLAAMSQFIACDSGGEPSATAEEKVKALLMAKPWKIKSMTVDGVDKSSLFTNFTITFSSGTYSTTNGGVEWPAVDSWSFTSNDATSFTRGDGIVVMLTEVTDTSLKLSFTWSKNTFGPGRAESVSGQTVFALGN